MSARAPGMVWTGVGPWPTGRLRLVSLTGAFVAWEADGPVLLRIPGSAFWYLACFTTITNLRAVYNRTGHAFTRIQTIDDEDAFLSSFEDQTDVRVIADPYFTPDGQVRFAELPTGPKQ